MPNACLKIVFQFTTLISLTVLCLIGWIEMFSNSILLPNLPPVNEFIVPIVILYVSFPINEIMHRKNVQEDDPYSRAHGTLSAVFPARYNMSTNILKCGMLRIIHKLVLQVCFTNAKWVEFKETKRLSASGNDNESKAKNLRANKPMRRKTTNPKVHHPPLNWLCA